MVITNLRQIFFKTFLELSKTFQSRVSKPCTQLSFAVKNLVCFIYFQRVIRNRCKIDTNRASITNWGKIITNRSSSSCYKSGQFQLLQIGAELLQIGAGITNYNFSSNFTSPIIYVPIQKRMVPSNCYNTVEHPKCSFLRKY